MKILAGNSNKPLAEAIVACLHLQLTNASIKRFATLCGASLPPAYMAELEAAGALQCQGGVLLDRA